MHYFNMKRSFKYIFLPVIVLFASLIAFQVVNVQAQLTPEQEAVLRQQLLQIEREIAEQQGILKNKQNEGVSIKRDIAILDAKIKQAQLKIKAHNLAIERLGKDITVKSQVIGTLSDRISRGHNSLSDILRKTNELDDFTLVEAFLARRNLSDFFLDVDSFNSLQDSLKTHVDNVKSAKAENEVEKKDLDQKRTREIDTKINVENEQRKIAAAEKEKQRLLSLNAQEQKNYQNSISANQKKAAEIRNALFPLRDAADINFQQALVIANEASKVTGIRPAFLLAIITQESNLGKNIGSCYLTNQETGAGVRASTGAPINNVMKPSRDVAPFLTITKELGRNPDKTLVSCPFTEGYGGAMGPAQFIPSTWMSNRSKIGAAVGKSTPDPWVPRDAFMASAIYLSSLGATSQGYTAERNAACRYYSGRTCSGSNTFYGDQVMAKANKIQGDIEFLQGQ
jgi:membrane-bound lytic murein transglycosylase B